MTTDTHLDLEPDIVQPTGLEPAWIDPQAYWAVERLQRNGFEAYLVGGCVRDLLLGRIPKDFDIATSAKPQQVKNLFSRCRIIGRRFKLVHLHFDRNRKILEVSTFRRTPEEPNADGDDDDLLITRDNEFGTAAEDAVRRDFTMNALFYDPVDDSLIDFVGGLADVHGRLLQTIGDPEVRFREDPVRILRAVKFCGRLDFTIEKNTLAAIEKVAPDLSRSAPPRILEEILRLLRSGHAFKSFRLLQQVGALQVLVPIVSRYLADSTVEERIVFWRVLDYLDGLVHRQPVQPPSGVLLGALFVLPVMREIEGSRKASLNTVAEECISSFAQELRLPRRDAACLKAACVLQSLFIHGGKRGRRPRPERLAHRPYFAETVTLLELLVAAGFVSAEHVELRTLQGYARREDAAVATRLAFVDGLQGGVLVGSGLAPASKAKSPPRRDRAERDGSGRDSGKLNRKHKRDRDRKGPSEARTHENSHGKKKRSARGKLQPKPHDRRAGGRPRQGETEAEAGPCRGDRAGERRHVVLRYRTQRQAAALLRHAARGFGQEEAPADSESRGRHLQTTAPARSGRWPTASARSRWVTGKR